MARKNTKRLPAEYSTELPPKGVLKNRFHTAVMQAKAQLEQRGKS
jgi:hypothetical protein